MPEHIGVFIDTNNNVSEVCLNMDMYTNNIGNLLNDKLTFVGQILREPEKCNAVIINGKNSKLNNLDKNEFHIPPFTDVIYGPIFIICMDSNSEPQSFSKNDLEEYIHNFESKYKSNYYE